jgi:hypothetical protein
MLPLHQLRLRDESRNEILKIYTFSKDVFRVHSDSDAAGARRTRSDVSPSHKIIDKSLSTFKFEVCSEPIERRKSRSLALSRI